MCYPCLILKENWHGLGPFPAELMIVLGIIKLSPSWKRNRKCYCGFKVCAGSASGRDHITFLKLEPGAVIVQVPILSSDWAEFYCKSTLDLLDLKYLKNKTTYQERQIVPVSPLFWILFLWKMIGINSQVCLHFLFPNRRHLSASRSAF